MKRPLVALGLFGAFAACNFETSFQLDPRVDSGRPPDVFAEACGASAEAACAHGERCDPDGFAVSWPDLATCRERGVLSCQIRMTDPHTQHDEAKLRDCALPLDFPCSTDANFEAEFAVYRARCPSPTGDLPIGSSCSLGSACMSGACYALGVNDPDLCGECIPRLCEGECTGADAICRVDLDGSSTCVILGPAGTACAEPTECATFACVEGSCAERRTVGQSCDPTGSDAAALCDAGLVCNQLSSRCAEIERVRIGEPCGPTLDGGLAICLGGGRCPFHANAKCIAPVVDGGLCDPTEGLDCLSPASCVAGYCRFHALGCGVGD